MSETRRVNGISALEMTMRDVLDNMADFGTQFAYDSSMPGCFEILSIEPPEPEPARQPVLFTVIADREVA